MLDRENVVRASYSIRPSQEGLIRQLAEREYDGNESLALRKIIDQWAAMTTAQMPLPLEPTR